MSAVMAGIRANVNAPQSDEWVIVEMVREFRERRRRKAWRRATAVLLMAHPFNWHKTDAESYAIEMAKLYYVEGYSPEDALAEDRSYW